MPMDLQLEDTAPWKQRFRAAAILWTRIARSAPDRGLAVTNPSGVYQLYAWDVASDELTQLTSQPEGKMLGLLAPDGQHVYYLDDQSGNEIGHYCRVPFEGGAKQDITPDLPPYSPTGLTVSGSGNRIGLAAGSAEGFCLYAIAPQAGDALSAPRALHTSGALFNAPMLSYDGQLAVVASTERSGKLQFSLLAIDTETAELVAELWDGPDTSVTPVCFSPLPGDTRLLATTNRTGTETLLVWDPASGQRVDLEFEGLEGTLEAHDWSPDGAQILLSTFDRAVQRVYVYGLESGELVELDLPSGSSFMPPYFAPGGEVLCPLADGDPSLPVASLQQPDGPAGAGRSGCRPGTRRQAVALHLLPLKRWPGDPGLAGGPRGGGTLPHHPGHARRAHRCRGTGVQPRGSELAGPRIRLPDHQLPGLDHLWPRVPGKDPGRLGPLGG